MVKEEGNPCFKKFISLTEYENTTSKYIYVNTEK